MIKHCDQKQLEEDWVILQLEVFIIQDVRIGTQGRYWCWDHEGVLIMDQSACFLIPSRTIWPVVGPPTIWNKCSVGMLCPLRDLLNFSNFSCPIFILAFSWCCWLVMNVLLLDCMWHSLCVQCFGTWFFSIQLFIAAMYHSSVHKSCLPDKIADSGSNLCGAPWVFVKCFWKLAHFLVLFFLKYVPSLTYTI